MGKAAQLAASELNTRSSRLLALRQRFEAGLAEIPDTVIHGADAERLPNTTHVAFAGVDGQSLLIRLDLAGYAVSAGAACSSGAVEPSSTLLAMGVSKREALSSVRVSFGVGNTTAEIDELLEAIATEVAELRRLAVAEP